MKIRNKLKQKKKGVDLFNSWINYRKHFTRLLNMMQHKVQSIGNFSNTTPTQLGNHQERSLSTGDNHVRGWAINPPRAGSSAQLSHCCPRAPMCAGQSHTGSDPETSGSAAPTNNSRTQQPEAQLHTKRAATESLSTPTTREGLQPLPWARGRM